MNLKLLLLLVLAWNFLVLSGQADLVYPNRPVAMLKTNQGPIAILEYNAGYSVQNDTLNSKGFNGFTALIGYQVNRSFIIAAGAGVSVYNNGTLVPVFGDLRYTFYISRLAPYLYADGGLLMDFSNFNSTTIFMNPGIGARYSISRKVAANISTGIYLQMRAAAQEVFLNMKAGVTYKF